MTAAPIPNPLEEAVSVGLARRILAGDYGAYDDEQVIRELLAAHDALCSKLDLADKALEEIDHLDFGVVGEIARSTLTEMRKA